MIKYEIYKDCFEVFKNNRLWFPKDMANAANTMDNDFTIIKSFDNLNDAEVFFNEEKKNCWSRYQESSVYDVVLFDILELRVCEYDEEGEIQSDKTYDSYIAPIEHSVNDIVEYVMSHACRYDKPEKIKKFITDTFTNIDDYDLNEVMEELSDNFFEE